DRFISSPAPSFSHWTMHRLALFASLVYVTWATCPNGFELVRNGDCYEKTGSNVHLNTKSGTDDYTRICGDAHAQTVMIKNQEDQDYWTSVATADHPNPKDQSHLAIGLECNRTTSRIQWTDGSAVKFTPEGTGSFDSLCSNSPVTCMWFIVPTTGNWDRVCNEDLTADLYCVVPHAPTTNVPDEECGSFSSDEDNGMCYQVIATPANRTEATTICRSLGSNFVSIHSKEVNSFVRRMAVSRGLVNGLMLGAAATGKGNTYKWNDGSNWDYNNFAPGFPIDGLGDCVAMETNNAQGPWINLDCSTPLPFACARNPKDTTEAMCDGNLRTENGDVIFSPGFPTYAAVPCDYIMKVDPGMLVEVEILFLEANTCCDHLILSEGTLGGPVIAVLTGEQNNNGTVFTTTSQNFMRASWQPTSGLNVKGMVITFRGVPKK
ncbi:hypothetical protein PFISCL1PPCAC_12932, partial [Pristionchus fissidentatus]